MKDKYGNIDSLLSKDESTKEPEPRLRRRRPSPALGVMTGETPGVSIVEGLRTEKNNLEQQIKAAQQNFDQERSILQTQLETLRKEGQGVALKMPVSGVQVNFTLKTLSPDVIDVSPENERIQEFLDEIALSDLLPSITKYGQQKAGTVRPKGDGRYELIEGSRRLATVKLLNRDYLALVGEVPDIDVRALSVVENQHKDVSPYEKAQSYLRILETGEYQNWTQLGLAYGISSSHISRYKACALLDPLFVKILPSPSDMSLSYAESIQALLKRDTETVVEKGKELLRVRGAAKSGSELAGCDQIIKLLKQSVVEKIAKPKQWKPAIYTSKDGRIKIKHSVTNKGATKLEFEGISKDKVEDIVKSILVKLNIQE